jgi:hypothetical protein
MAFLFELACRGENLLSYLQHSASQTPCSTVSLFLFLKNAHSNTYPGNLLLLDFWIVGYHAQHFLISHLIYPVIDVICEQLSIFCWHFQVVEEQI